MPRFKIINKKDLINLKNEKKKSNVRMNQIARHLALGQPFTWDQRLIITPCVKAVKATPQGKQTLEVHRS